MEKFKKALSKYFSRHTEKENLPNDTAFVDLTPIDNADLDGGYQRALSFALKSSRIKNVALSGPYGSGKSSIINTFFKKNPNFKFLKISLAAFHEDADSQVETVDIERSILQQMLYGADANKLPFSRFKRIATPQYPKLKSFLLIAWALATFYIYKNRSEWVVIDISLPIHWGKILLNLFAIAGLTYIISEIYKASFGYSLKKVSLKNAEIETDEFSEKSILNHHLDEIIYFFQETNYDIVVIEDLDRFGDPEIFVKLREINKLINDNHKTSGQTKFLYALKDDMFVNKNRTKFFDFIVPVIPIINASNSLDKMQERLNEHEFGSYIELQFLREVSLYLDDLRLIQNIFNEFVIYYEHLKSERLDVTKLLAMMIYKNLYPSDFENLHHGRGIFHSICQRKSEYVDATKSQLRSQIERLEEKIELSKSEERRNVSELMGLYLGQIMTHSGNDAVLGLVINETHVLFPDILTEDNFDHLISETNIRFAVHVQAHQNYRRPTGLPFTQIEKELNPEETFLDRKENIKNKFDEGRTQIEDKIRSIEQEISQVTQLEFSQLINGAEIDYEKLMEGANIRDSRLLLYLIKNGYLDDNYYLYISNFHEGRLTTTDRDFLLTIRNFSESDPTQVIDTPEEVCVNMRKEDFKNKYVLNVDLMDYLIAKRSKRKTELNSALTYISRNFDKSEKFLAAYYNQGKHLEIFVKELCVNWPNFSKMAVSSNNHSTHVSNILKFADQNTITKKMNSGNVLSNYIGEQGHLVFAEKTQQLDNYEILSQLSVKFGDLSLFESTEELRDFAIDERLYVINPDNVTYILRREGTDATNTDMTPEKSNYSMLVASKADSLKGYVEENISSYVTSVFLELPENSDENESAIVSLLNNSSLENSAKINIISKQSHVFSSFDNVPTAFWSQLLEEEKITLSWDVASKFLDASESDENVLTDVMQGDTGLEYFSNTPISESELGKEKSKALSKFILNNDALGDEEYCSLINSIPYRYKNFPTDVSEEKLYCLADLGKISLTEESFDFCDENDDLKIKLISTNITSYIGQKDKYEVDDDVREGLLKSDITSDQKLTVALDLEPSFVEGNKSLSILLNRLFVSIETIPSTLDDNVLSSAIVNASSAVDSIKLLLKSISRWDEANIMEMLSQLGKPFSEIPKYGKHPKIPKTQVNMDFLTALKDKGCISSFTNRLGYFRVNTYKSQHH